MRRAPQIAMAITSLTAMILFQNCSRAGIAVMDSGNGKLGVCDGISCELTPLTDKPAVTTILLALGDEADNQLVINGASSQLIAETVVRYSSPAEHPKILVVRDYKNSGEDPEDTRYVVEELLNRYDVTYLEETKSGLSDADLKGYDVVWFNNPGHSMGSVNTRDALLRFAGGIILQGDDLSQGSGFSVEALTGLKHLDNGTSVKCSDEKYYAHDNNNGSQFRVTLDASKITGESGHSIEFRYGNDIDNTVVARSDLEIIATGKGGPEVCNEARPAIVRYLK